MTRKDKAVDLFKQRFNCSQAIFAAYREPDMIDEQTALKLATVFGAGVAGTGHQLCGAVTGALLAISLRHGRGDLESVEAKAVTYELAQRFMAEFGAQNGSCLCEKVIGVDLGTPEGREKAQELRLFETRCADAVRSAAVLLDRLL